MPDPREDYDYLYQLGENSYQDPWNTRTLFGPRENRALTSQETVNVVGASPDNPGPPPIMNRANDYHPSDMREGLMEKAIKYAASHSGNILKDDRVYLEQYLHPERDIIPRQPLRPTQLSNMPNMAFRRVPSYQPLPKEDPSYTVPNLGGLGNYTTGETNDYTSVYDTWDFDTNARLIGNMNEQSTPFNRAANWGAKKFLQYAGTPFAVYERIPKEKQR